MDEQPQVTSTSVQSAEIGSARDAKNLGGDRRPRQFDVSDILADYFTAKIDRKPTTTATTTTRDDTFVRYIPCRKYELEKEGYRDDYREASRKLRKYKKDHHKRSKRRERSSSAEPVFGNRDRKETLSHQRNLKSHRRDDDHRDNRDHQSNRYRSRERRRNTSTGRSPTKDRQRPSPPWHESRGFNKNELFEVARRNVKQMFDNGTLPKGCTVDPEKMGLLKDRVTDTIERYTQMCRKIRDEDENQPSSSRVNHPFTVKDKPIKMNITNSISLPVKTAKEKILSAQFPVSSGSSHRELEWRPVQVESPVTSWRRARRSPDSMWDLERNTASVSVPERRSEPRDELNIDTGYSSLPQRKAAGLMRDLERNTASVSVSDRRSEPRDKLEIEIAHLSLPQLLKRREEVLRRLQDNPFDIEAKETEKHCSNAIKGSNTSGSISGQSTGSVGPPVKLLSASELRTGPQAWTRKNQLKNTKALDGGIGMTLLQKMGWTPGTALGKNQEGVLEPVLPSVKFDRKGLVAQEELVKNSSSNAAGSTANRSAPESAAIQRIIDRALFGKHPVTLILEICTARKLQQPRFIDLPPMGEPHDRTFLCRVDFNGKVFIPTRRSLTKKLAKAQAALLVLADMGEYNPAKQGVHTYRRP